LCAAWWWSHRENPDAVDTDDVYIWSHFITGGTHSAHAMAHKQQSHATNRRQLLKTALGTGVVAASGLGPLMAQASVARTRIDVHAHLLPSFYRQALSAYNVETVGGQAIPAWSPTAAVGFMNKFGIQAQVLSLPEPGLAFLSDHAARVQMAKQVNNYLHDELIDVPFYSPLYRRFGGFASLPLGDPNDDKEVTAACLEAVRALTTLGLDGVTLYTSYNGIYLGDAKLAPLMRTLSLLGAYVFVQPVAPPTASALDIPASILEFPFETSRAAVNMLYKGYHLLYPNIRWQLADGGGAIPFLSYRSGLLALNLNPDRSSFGKLYYDTASATAPATMASIREITELGHVLLGTNYPFSEALYAGKSTGDPNVELNQAFSASERQMVDRSNALAQLPRLAKRLGLR
jgi:6-methylsalicylate decarboxylase